MTEALLNQTPQTREANLVQPGPAVEAGRETAPSYPHGSAVNQLSYEERIFQLAIDQAMGRIMARSMLAE